MSAKETQRSMILAYKAGKWAIYSPRTGVFSSGENLQFIADEHIEKEERILGQLDECGIVLPPTDNYLSSKRLNLFSNMLEFTFKSLVAFLLLFGLSLAPCLFAFSTLKQKLPQAIESTFMSVSNKVDKLTPEERTQIQNKIKKIKELLDLK